VASSADKRGEQAPEELTGDGLTPSDQLLALFAVNAILAAWVGLSFWRYYPHPPSIPTWIYWVEGLILVTSAILSLLDTLWPRLKRIAIGVPSSTQLLKINITVMKAAVFVITGSYVVVIWQLAEATGGVLSPYAPFLPAPAIFVSFVTKKWWTIGGLSLVVAVFIVFSTLEVPEPLPDLKAYQGSAGVMVLLAGMLSALQAQVVSTGQPLTGQGSTDSARGASDDGRRGDGGDWPDLDDDDLAPGMES
jgi:hypothetical protein